MAGVTPLSVEAAPPALEPAPILVPAVAIPVEAAPAPEPEPAPIQVAAVPIRAEAVPAPEPEPAPIQVPAVAVPVEAVPAPQPAPAPIQVAAVPIRAEAVPAPAPAPVQVAADPLPAAAALPPAPPAAPVQVAAVREVEVSASPPAGPPPAPKDDRLEKRALELIRHGDISGARLMLERALADGSGQAAFHLAQTYDPVVLARWQVRGLRGDPVRARVLYGSALARGVEEAREHIVQLEE
jgi:hypothetical protein